MKMAHSHGYCKLAVLWLRLLCDAGCRPERPRWGRPGLRPATLATASWDVLAYGQQPSQRPLGTSWPTASHPMGLLFWGALYTGVPCFALHHLP